MRLITLIACISLRENVGWTKTIKEEGPDGQSVEGASDEGESDGEEVQIQELVGA